MLNARTSLCVFFFNDTATTEIYTLSLHDALPISTGRSSTSAATVTSCARSLRTTLPSSTCTTCSTSSDRKSTRLNSSHSQISYAVFCLKKNIHQPFALTQDRKSTRLNSHHCYISD